MTAVRAPAGIDSGDVIRGVRDRFGITIANGQGELKGKIFRLGHIGWFDVFDITTQIAAVELVLAELGADVDRGVAVTAALEAFDAPSRARDVERGRVLVREEISEAGVELLRSRFDVDVDGEPPSRRSSATTTRSSSGPRRS